MLGRKHAAHLLRRASFGPTIQEIETFSAYTVSEALDLLLQGTKRKARAVLNGESRELEVTKSLLNVLDNAVLVGSIPVSPVQKEYLDQHSAVVWQLLAKSGSLSAKKALLQANIPLVVAIAASCPTVVG